MVLRDQVRDVRSDDEEGEQESEAPKKAVNSTLQKIEAGKEEIVANGVATKEGMNGQLNGRQRKGETLNGTSRKDPARDDDELKKKR